MEGRTAHVFEIRAREGTAYRVIETRLGALAGQHPFALLIEAASDNPRPLGIALDWMEVDRGDQNARFILLPSTRVAILALVLLSYLALWLAGASRPTRTVSCAGLLAAASLGIVWDVVAAERIVREGLPVYAATALAAVALCRWAFSRTALGLEAPSSAGWVCLLALAGVGLRLGLLLHPQFYYPDVHVHGLFAWQLARRGLWAFFADFTENQFRYSLGLQLVGGHWYAFPYPPAFYLLTWPLTHWVGHRPDVAVSVLAAAVNGLSVFVVFGIAHKLGLPRRACLGAAAACPLLPLFLARLTLAYFPALVGQAIDGVVLLFLASRARDLDRPRAVAALAGLLGLALLTYTQSLLNFGILLPLFLLLEMGFDRDGGARRRQLGLALAGLLGVGLATAAFYGRYFPIFLDMQRGVPMPEERIVLEIFERRAATAAPEDLVPEPPDDPYAGPGVDPVRGLRKAAWRAYVFYGAFTPVVLLGVGLLIRDLKGSRRRLILAWALTYLLLNLASGGLPGPNLVRYHKDLEIVAPLFCIALGMVGHRLWGVARPLGWLFLLGFWGFGTTRAVRYLTEKFVLDR